MPVNVLIGLQRGDEGKGRFVDMMAAEHDIVARFNGGNNAGHTVVLPSGQDLALHLVPSGVAYPHTMNIIGNGTLVSPVKLVEEIADIESKGLKVSPKNLMISSATHLILPHHICEDEIQETGADKQGSTKRGIAQAASSKALRNGVRTEMIIHQLDELTDIVRESLRVQRVLRADLGWEPIDEDEAAELYMSSARAIRPYVTDTVIYLNEQLRTPKPARVLAEGAQAFLLDIDHGMYPFTTSSSTTSGGAATGLGIPPYFIEHVTGVAKAVPSHVGGGPFVTEVSDKKLLEKLHGNMTTVDAEVGTTTGRIRRLGYLDLPQLRRAQIVNGAHDMALSKLDWVPRNGNKVQICVAYKLDGAILSVAPASARELDKCQPVYEDLPTWQEDIQGIREFKDLPATAQRYVEFIEKQTDIPITMIGVGPQRDQVILR